MRNREKVRNFGYKGLYFKSLSPRSPSHAPWTDVPSQTVPHNPPVTLEVVHLLSNAALYHLCTRACGERQVNPTGPFREPQFPRLQPPSPSASTSSEPSLVRHPHTTCVDASHMCYSQGADKEKNIQEENLDPDSSGDFLSKYFCICKETSFCLLQLQQVLGPSCGRCKNHQFASALSHPMGLSHLPLSLLTLLSPASLQFLTKQSAARCETNHQNLACLGVFFNNDYIQRPGVLVW